LVLVGDHQSLPNGIEGDEKMSKSNIIRAWKDEEFRSSLGEAEREMIPENPAGLMELTDEALDVLAGGVAQQANSCDWCSCALTEDPPRG
jgi:mersacidin/lichenicidin family type 2 lantibiotic